MNPSGHIRSKRKNKALNNPEGIILTKNQEAFKRFTDSKGKDLSGFKPKAMKPQTRHKVHFAIKIILLAFILFTVLKCIKQKQKQTYEISPYTTTFSK